jgi:peptidoglycan/LPS O-acetylase OafA/YrhL
MTLGSPLIACLILQLVVLRKSPLWCWLDWQWVRYGGALSFSAYLYHHIGLSLGRKMPVIGATAGGMMWTLVLAALSYHLVEMPAHRYLRRRRDLIAARTSLSSHSTCSFSA